MSFKNIPAFALIGQGDPALAKLSPREMTTVRGLAAGLTNRQIAARLGINVKTVDTHRTHLLKKIGARNNADLTRWAISNGLVNLDGSVEYRADDEDGDIESTDVD